MEMEMQIASVENADKRLIEIPNLNFAISAKADYYNGLIQGFKDGAKWADKTMIEKVCEWLDYINVDDYMDNCNLYKNNLIIDLKEAMEE